MKAESRFSFIMAISNALACLSLYPPCIAVFFLFFLGDIFQSSIPWILNLTVSIMACISMNVVFVNMSSLFIGLPLLYPQDSCRSQFLSVAHIVHLSLPGITLVPQRFAIRVYEAGGKASEEKHANF
jgi:hypothetical protein